MTRMRMAAAGMAALVVLALTAPFAGAAATNGSRGSTATEASIFSLELTEVPALGTIGASLGVALGDASTMDTPAARLLLEALKAGGQTLGAHEVTSDDTGGSQEVTVPLSGPGIDGSITVAELRAEADADSALAVLNALEADLEVGPIGTSANIAGQGFSSSVDATSAAGHAGVSLGPVKLSLGNLLPDDLLEALPLSVLLELLEGLDLNLADALQGAIDQLRAARATMEDIEATVADLADAQATLDDLLAGRAEVAAARQAVADAEAAVMEAADELDLCAISCDLLNQQLQIARDDLTAAEAALDTALDALNDQAINAARAVVDQIEAQLDALIDELEALLGNLPDLDQLIDDILDALSGAPILEIGKLQVSVATSADEAAGEAATVCKANGVKVLGNPIGGTSCEALRATFNELRDGIFGLLDGLPVVGSLPRPTIEGLQTQAQGSDGPDADGFTSARASLTALTLKVPSVSLKAVVDDLVSDLLEQIESVTDGTPLDAPLEQVLDDLAEQLEGLPTGDLLAGVKTVGLSLRAGGLSSVSRFAATATPQGATQERGPTDVLPFTGAEILFTTALGLWVLVMGSAMSLHAARVQTPRRK